MTEPSQYNRVSRQGLRNTHWWHRLAFIERRLVHAIDEGVRQLNLDDASIVLDYGCADRPYRSLLPAGSKYIGADLIGNPEADVTIDAEGRIEVEDASCDAVLSTQVLEHVADPQVYLNEAWRVLKPGGRLLISTHGLMVYHPDPVDYWRWTGAGLQKVLADAGFEVIRFDGVMGLGAAGLQFVQDALWPRLPRPLRAALSLCMQGLIFITDRLHSAESRRMNALVFIALATKPIEPDRDAGGHETHS